MLSQLQLRDAYLERIGSSALRSGDRAEPYRIQLTRDVHENRGFDSQHPLLKQSSKAMSLVWYGDECLRRNRSILGQ